MTEKAIFSLGCFWGVEDFFSGLKGVVKTRVGYAGGAKINPTYEDTGDHAESIEIEYDPGRITYEDLVKYFWEQHNPTDAQKRQYSSAILYLDDEQKKIAGRFLSKIKNGYYKPVLTEIKPAGIFYAAEDYHQKYYEKLRKQKDAQLQK